MVLFPVRGLVAQAVKNNAARATKREIIFFMSIYPSFLNLKKAFF
jgi:hypothetical protein